MKNIIPGRVEISRVVEWQGAFATTGVLLPSVPAGPWRQNESWPAPDLLNAETGEWQANVQTGVLRSVGRTDPDAPEPTAGGNCPGGARSSWPRTRRAGA
ncbi:hypothetical protein GCM10022223_11090 [Kineosporia mesophila]|uniref:Uncharacterized protein n=1 Tax=Kineosporia mesophila TaxID=566012 RepID=A0ABP6Z4T8_9ACTN|nr:hypothetical protein [Kineosporia mesophila]MCD5352587.1 hypothetical protein [Kineosporia mesophila]